jgi:hypothetical protein
MRIIKTYRLLPLIIFLGVLNWAAYHFFVAHRFDAIVLHHSASWQDNYQSIRHFHMKQTAGIKDARYHLILSNGRAGVPAGHLEATGRYRYLGYSLATRNRGYNLTAVHICLIGNYDQRPVAGALQPAIGHALKTISEKYHIPLKKILFHRDVGKTVCPGRYITKEKMQGWINSASAGCTADIKTQHNAVIDHAGYSLWTLPRSYVVIMLSLSLLTLAVWTGLHWIYQKRQKKKFHDTAFSCQCRP